VTYDVLSSVMRKATDVRNNGTVLETASNVANVQCLLKCNAVKGTFLEMEWTVFKMVIA